MDRKFSPKDQEIAGRLEKLRADHTDIKGNIFFYLSYNLY